MFKYISLIKQIRIEKDKNVQLNIQVQELEDAIVELAEIACGEQEEQSDDEDIL